MNAAEKDIVTDTLIALFDSGILGHEIALETPEEIKQFRGRNPSPPELRAAYVAVFINMVMTDLELGEGQDRRPYQRTKEEMLDRAQLLLCAIEIIRREMVARDRRNAKTKTRKAPKRRPRRRPKASD